MWSQIISRIGRGVIYDAHPGAIYRALAAFSQQHIVRNKLRTDGRDKSRPYRSLLAIAILLLAGCSAERLSTPKVERGYVAANRQLAPEPVYNRTRWVQSPSPLPTKVAASKAPLVMPVVNLDLKNATLEETARILAKVANYGSYCSSQIADRKITINRLGTVEELAQQVASLAHIEAVVDHDSRQVRFMAGVSNRDVPDSRFYENQ